MLIPAIRVISLFFKAGGDIRVKIFNFRDLNNYFYRSHPYSQEWFLGILVNFQSPQRYLKMILAIPVISRTDDDIREWFCSGFETLQLFVLVPENHTYYPIRLRFRKSFILSNPTAILFLVIFWNEITTILTPSISERGAWGWSRLSFGWSLIRNPQC